MMLKFGCVVFMVSVGVNSAQAQFVQARRNVDAGKTTVVWSFFNCATNAIHAVSGSASHGAITSRPVKQNRCGNRTQDAVVADYTPQPGYRGPDSIYLYWGQGGRSTLHVNVR